MKHKICILAIGIFLIPVLLFSAENRNPPGSNVSNNNIPAENAQNNKLSFMVLDLKTENCPEDYGKKISLKIKERISVEKTFQINNPGAGLSRNLNYAECLNAGCLSAVKKNYPDKIVIVGVISQTDTKVFDRQLSRYAVKDKDVAKYIVDIVVINTKKNSNDLRFKKKLSSEDRFIIEAEAIGNEIRNFYLKQKKTEIAVPVKVPEKAPVIVPVIVPEIVPVKVPDKKPDSIYEIDGIAFSASLIFPMSGYAEAAKFGYGIDAELNGRIKRFKNFYISPEISVYNLSPAKDSLDSAQMLSLNIKVLYQLFQIENIFISPFIRAGYVFSFLNEDKSADKNNPPPEYNYKYNIYYNPSAAFGMELGYDLTKEFRVIADASLDFFADSRKFYPFYRINLGIRRNL